MTFDYWLFKHKVTQSVFICCLLSPHQMLATPSSLSVEGLFLEIGSGLHTSVLACSDAVRKSRRLGGW